MGSYEKMDADTAAKYREADNLRKLAFFGVALSTVATLVCVISVPMIYNYMQHVQSVLQNEVDFCKVSSRSLPLCCFTRSTIYRISVALGQLVVGGHPHPDDEGLEHPRQASGCGSERIRRTATTAS